MSENVTSEVSDTDRQIALYKALADFQRACPSIIKNKTAKIKTDKGYTYEYQYADLGTIVSSIRPSLAEHGLAFSQSIDTREDGKTTLTTSLFHTNGAVLSSSMLLPIANLQPQAIGSLLTYYRRYSLSALLGIAAEDDDDGAMAQNIPETQPSTPAQAPASLGAMPQHMIDKFIKEFQLVQDIDILRNSRQVALSTAQNQYEDTDAYKVLNAAATARKNELITIEKSPA